MNTPTWIHASSTLLLGPLALGAIAAAQDPLQPPGLGFTRDFEVASGGQAPGGPVYALASYDDGSGPKLYVGGDFYYMYNYSPFISQNIVRWDGANWSSVGLGGVDYSPPDISGSSVNSICGFDGPNGPNLFISGRFNRYYSQSAGAWLQCYGFLRWDGTDYSIPPLGGGVGPTTMVVLDEGSGPALYAGGGRVARFDGTTWTILPGLFQRPPPFYYGSVDFLTVHDDGSGPKLYAAGVFSGIWQDPGPAIPANGFARFEGGHWVALPSPADITGYPTVRGLVNFDDGHGGVLYHSDSSNIWKMQGGAWQPALPLPVGLAHQVHGLTVYDDGTGSNLFAWGNIIRLPGLASGEFAKIARFDGVNWSQVGPTFSTTDSSYNSSSAVFDFGEGPDLYLSGLPNGVSGQQAIGLARYRGVYRDVAPVCGGDGSLILCPCGTRGEVGHGCPSSSSPAGARLRGQGLPNDDSLRFEATSLPASALCVLFQGSAYDYSANFAGDGIRCAAGTTFRLRTVSAQGGVVNIPGAGEPSLRALANAHGDPLMAGSVRHYQVWYRDADASFCTTAGLFNATNGMRVVW